MIRTLVRDFLTFPADSALGWRQDRWRGVWRELRVRTVQRFFRRGCFLLIEEELNQLVPVDLPEGIRVEPFQGEWAELEGVVPHRLHFAFERWAGRGRTCMLAWRGSRPVGYTWCSESMDPEIEFLPLALPDDTAYLWALTVIPSERNRGVGSALAWFRLHHARGRGFRKAWRAVDPANLPSMRTVEKTSGGDARILGELSYVRLLRKPWFRFRPMAGGPQELPVLEDRCHVGAEMEYVPGQRVADPVTRER